jgi:hypothetical protein
MLSRITKFSSSFNSQSFSILADCRDLSNYNFDQMNNILYTWNRKVYYGNKYFDVEWEDDKTRIIIRYNNDSFCFVQIVEEEWKFFKLVFSNNFLL